MRIAVGGFQHETNTFAPTKADYAAFEQADSWPALSRGDALFDAVAGINLPIAGFIEAAQGQGHRLLPLSWCSATPSAHVTEDAFERIAALLLEGIAAAKPDALYLDLHGAMVTEQHEDGEGELLRRIRDLVGTIPIVASLDLHTNITAEMVELSSGLVAYRTYPHVDMADTGGRAARLLDALARHDKPPAKAFHKFDFLIPLTGQCTLIEPAAGLYGDLAPEEREGVLSLSLAMGFPAADIAECGPAVCGFGTNQDAVDAAVDSVASAVRARSGEFAGELLTPDEAVRRAMEGPGPVVIADTQDNPGGGGPSDGVGMLEALVRNRARGAVVGLLRDPEVATAAHRAGEGGTIEVGLGAKSGFPGQNPVHGRYAVERLGDGRFTATGPVWLGSRMDLGPMALLKVLDAGDADVRVIVTTRKFQAADQAPFRHLGVEPAETPILVLKSSVHFRADFEPIARDVLVACAPGPNLANPVDFPYRNLRPGIRLTPDGPIYQRNAAN
jgi:microcystin degradation protein MlrC